MTMSSGEVEKVFVRAAQRFSELREVICTNPYSLPAMVAQDPELWNDAVARFLLGYFERFYTYLRPDVAAMVVEAATVACRNTENPDVRVRAWKAKANVLRIAANFGEAEAWLTMARDYVLEEVCIDADFYLAVIGYAQAMIAWDQRKTERAIGMMSIARGKFRELGENARADAIQRFSADIALRVRRFDEAAEYFREELRTAKERHDSVLEARARQGLAECAMGRGRFDEASRYVNEALEICRAEGMDWALLRIECTAALIALGRDGIAGGLAQMEAVRDKCKAAGLPGLAVRCLLYGVETIVDVLDEPDAQEIEGMCFTVQREAAALDLTVDVAEATERLRVAAIQHRVTRDHVENLLAVVMAGAKYAEDTKRPS